MTSFIVDLDGVLRRGESPVEGAQALLDAMEDYLVVTNNSTRTSEMYTEELGRIGLSIPRERIFTSAEATALFLKSKRDYSTAWVIGEKGLTEEVEKVGYTLTEECECVVVGLDRALTYQKLEVACVAIRRGAEFIGSNPDLTFPTERGIVPGCGATLAYLEACTGKSPLVVGKPNRLIVDLALGRLKDKNAYVVGDRLDTDVLAGVNAGLRTVLVLTGVEDEESVRRSVVKPDFVLRDLRELKDFVVSHR